jgi:hypothetical protein
VKRVAAARRALRKARRAGQDITAELMPPRTFIVLVTVPVAEADRLRDELHPDVLSGRVSQSATGVAIELLIDATREPIALRLAARAVERLGGTVLHTEARPNR